jgi:branched-chain amino acid transport system permease protein
MDWNKLLELTIYGVALASIYAIAASGLVVTYTTSGIFNFAHGAIGMLMAFAYWQVRVNWGGPTWLSLLVVLGFVAPLTGAAIERLLIRNLRAAPLAVTLVVTAALMVGLMGLATVLWPPNQSRLLPGFFTGDTVTIGSTIVTYQQLLTIGLAVLLAIGLRSLFLWTRTGIAMRAVVDSRDLVALNGGRPVMLSTLSWALGAMLAGLAGILLASGPTGIGLAIEALTLVVINAYAAALFGRLRSIPFTFVGALVIGLVQQYSVGYNLSDNAFVNTQVIPVVPYLMLFVALLLMPEGRLRGAQLLHAIKIRVPSLRTSIFWSGVLVLAGWVVAELVTGTNLTAVSKGVAIGIIMLSLVPLTGYAGQISLCQMTFAGVGAFAMSRIASSGTTVGFGSLGIGNGSPLGLLAAFVLAAAVGALIALPAIRLQGLYLALGTMAFAVIMSSAFFEGGAIFGAGSTDAGAVQRPDFGLFSLSGNAAYLVFLMFVFGIVAVGVLALRRGPLGRRLLALRDSPAAVATLGGSPTRTKLLVFSLSAGLAGLGGALYGGVDRNVTPGQFSLFGPPGSLSVFVLAVVGGVATVSGPLLGGQLLMMVPVFFTWLGTKLKTDLTPYSQVLFGLAGIGLGRNPGGAVAEISTRFRALVTDRTVRETESEANGPPIEELLVPGTPLGAPISESQLLELDALLDLEEVSGLGRA